MQKIGREKGCQREGGLHIQYYLHENYPNHMLLTGFSLIFTCQLEWKMPLLSFLTAMAVALALFYLGYFKIPQGWGLRKGQVNADMI